MSKLGKWENRDLSSVRFFVDEDLSAFGKSLMHLRRDVVVAKVPPVVDLVPHYDEDWIPVVTDRGWVVITNDKHIRTRPWEASSATRHALCCVHLVAGEDATPWDFMRLLLRHWDRVDEVCVRQGPIWLALRFGESPRELPYEPGKPPRLPSR